MKKVGIITFHASHNNGSMLQALALQHVLTQRYPVSAEIVNFSNAAQQNMYRPFPRITNWKKLVKNAIWFTNYNQMQKQYNAYNSFSHKYFRLSEGFYGSQDDLRESGQNYAAIIAGSDQVWNIKCTDADDAYYLNWIHGIPKYAYAVSFGANNPFILQKKTGYYESLVRDFRNISVREFNAHKWIAEATGWSVPICLDPTMLLDRDSWEALVDIGDAPVITGDYIFYYCFSITNEVQKFLNRISRIYKMPVYFMDAKEWTLKACWRNNIHLIREYGPDVYLNVVKYARIFITTSFHGTAFSYQYRKCFWYINDGSGSSGKDDRALTFLSQLGLMDRYKTIPELLQTDLLQEKDYTEAEKRLLTLRAESFAYLDKIAEDIQNGTETCLSDHRSQSN